MEKTTFTLTEDHLKLLQRMYVGWQDCEYGAPEIDPKRPYGNSNVEEDICEILAWNRMDEAQEEEDYYPYREDLRKKALLLPKEMEIALQIILCTQQFLPGKYIKTYSYDDRSWVWVDIK